MQIYRILLKTAPAPPECTVTMHPGITKPCSRGTVFAYLCAHGSISIESPRGGVAGPKGMHFKF